MRGRDRGESAADAGLRELRIQVDSVSPTVGLIEGCARFMRVVHDTDSLKARLRYIQQDALVHLETTPREKAGSGSGSGDPLPLLVAGQLSWVHSTLLGHIGRETVAGRKPDEVSREALVLLDEMEDVLGDKALNYGRRAAG
ncbi:hypothetical protein [Streptomyces atratus]|uniref:hypothetical protein n=1 Tax=Streptomyces atratus TaxID=1893 RepID=UPI0033FFCD2F